MRPASVLFEDGEALEIVLTGAGEAARYRLGARLTCETIACARGTGSGALAHGMRARLSR